jgi:hypothetical protein
MMLRCAAAVTASERGCHLKKNLKRETVGSSLAVYLDPVGYQWFLEATNDACPCVPSWRHVSRDTPTRLLPPTVPRLLPGHSPLVSYCSCGSPDECCFSPSPCISPGEGQTLWPRVSDRSWGTGSPRSFAGSAECSQICRSLSCLSHLHTTTTGSVVSPLHVRIACPTYSPCFS